MSFIIYFNESVFSIVLQSELNNVKIDSEMNIIFNFLKTFYFCLIHNYRTLLINFVKNTATSVKNLMNC